MAQSIYALAWAEEHGYSEDELAVARQLIAAYLEDNPYESTEIGPEVLLQALSAARAYLSAEKRAAEAAQPIEELDPLVELRALRVILRTMTLDLMHSKRRRK